MPGDVCPARRLNPFHLSNQWALVPSVVPVSARGGGWYLFHRREPVGSQFRVGQCLPVGAVEPCFHVEPVEIQFPCPWQCLRVEPVEPVSPVEPVEFGSFGVWAVSPVQATVGTRFTCRTSGNQFRCVQPVKILPWSRLRRFTCRTSRGSSRVGVSPVEPVEPVSSVEPVRLGWRVSQCLLWGRLNPFLCRTSGTSFARVSALVLRVERLNRFTCRTSGTSFARGACTRGCG